MKVYELNIKTYLFKNLDKTQVNEELSKFIIECLCEDQEFLKYHKSKDYKFYTHDSLIPIKDYYEKDNLYNFRIRTIDENLLKYLKNNFSKYFNDTFQNLKLDIKEIKKIPIKTLYTLQPVVMKNDDGYWAKNNDLKFFEERLKINLIKKYENFTGKSLNKDFYNNIEFTKDFPVKMKFKDINFLTDKIKLNINFDKDSQDLAYFSLGVGLLENNAYGFGFLSYEYL